jgi:hypothetical protein
LHAQGEIHRLFHFAVPGEKPANRQVTHRSHYEPDSEAGNDRNDDSEPIGPDGIALGTMRP